MKICPCWFILISLDYEKQVPSVNPSIVCYFLLQRDVIVIKLIFPVYLDSDQLKRSS